MDGRMTHQRNSQVVRSSVFEEVRPEDIAPRRLRKKTGYRPNIDTFDRLFGSSLSSRCSVTRRRILGPSHQANLPSAGPLGTSTFPKDMNRNFYDDNMTSVLHRPLELNGSSKNQEPSINGAHDWPAGATELPPLQRVIRASGGSSTVDICRVPMVTETREDLPSDIFWLGDPPVDLSNSTGAQPKIEEAPSSYASTGQSSYDLGSAICWLGDPVLKAPQPKSDSCRSHLRSNPFDVLQTRAPASCRIRQERNIRTLL